MQFSITGIWFGADATGGLSGLVATPGDTGGASVSADLTGKDPAEGAQKLRFVSQPAIQVSQPIGAAGVSLFPRGNKKITVTFSVSRVHDDEEKAAYFCFAHEFPFPIQGKLTCTTTAGNLTYPGVVAYVSAGTVEGATTSHDYVVIIGGTAPSGTSGASGPTGSGDTAL